MITKRKAILLALAGATIVLWGIVLVKHKQNAPQTARSTFRELNPQLAAAVESQITNLDQETVERSVVKLASINMYFWPGAPVSDWVEFGGLPLGSNVDDETLHTIMSNRRFRKVLGEVGQLDKRGASQLVSTQLSNAVAQYLPLYAEEIIAVSNHYRVSDISNTTICGPSFVISTTNDDDVVILGARLKVLSLVWISGLLELRDLKQQVCLIANMAVKQRDEMYAANSLDLRVREQVLSDASLYNRKILGYALLGLSEKSTEREAALDKSKLQVCGFALVSFNAAATEYERSVQTGYMKPDTSLGTVVVKFMSPTTDTAFDDLSRALMALP